MILRNRICDNGDIVVYFIHDNIIYLICGIDTVSLDLSELNCGEIPDLSRFTQLIELDISSNKISHIPKLPQSLRRLTCKSNTITHLNNLPLHLEFLDCRYNSLLNISNLPPHIKHIKTCAHSFVKLNRLQYGFNSINMEWLPCELKSLSISGLHEYYCEDHDLIKKYIPPCCKYIIATQQVIYSSVGNGGRGYPHGKYTKWWFGLERFAIYSNIRRQYYQFIQISDYEFNWFN